MNALWSEQDAKLCPETVPADSFCIRHLQVFVS
jgi:hypothetical protein